VGLTVVQYEEKPLSIQTILNQFMLFYTKIRTSSISVKHRMIGIDERMEKMF